MIADRECNAVGAVDQRDSPVAARPADNRRPSAIEVAWGIFALVNVAVMLHLKGYQTVPFHFIWVSLGLLYGVRVWRPRTTAAVTLAVCLTTGIALVLAVREGFAGWDEVTEVPLMTAMFAAMVMDARRRQAAIKEAERAIEALKQAQAERSRLLNETVQAAEDERKRIAAELHDGPIQRLTAVDFMLESVVSGLERTDQTSSREVLESAQSATRDEINNLRGMMSELRPPILDERGLEAALQDYVDTFRHEAGLACTFEARLAARLDPTLEAIVYRVAQQALANVVKHARADNAWLSLRSDDGKVILEVGDDGIGFDPGVVRGPVDGHFGLMGMRERVEMAGGRWEIVSRPGAGTRILAALPTGGAAE